MLVCVIFLFDGVLWTERFLFSVALISAWFQLFVSVFLKNTTASSSVEHYWFSSNVELHNKYIMYKNHLWYFIECWRLNTWRCMRSTFPCIMTRSLWKYSIPHLLVSLSKKCQSTPHFSSLSEYLQKLLSLIKGWSNLFEGGWTPCPKPPAKFSWCSWF